MNNTGPAAMPPALQLIGRISVVVGAGAIGAGTAVELARAGSDVAVLYRSDDVRAVELCTAIKSHNRRALPIRCDILDGEAVAEAAARIGEELGRPAILVHAAAQNAPWKPLVDLSLDEWRQATSVDLDGTFNLLRSFVPRMRGFDASIVAVSSIAASNYPAGGGPNAAGKAALEALIRVLAREEGRNAIRANVVAIGLTQSDKTDRLVARWGTERTERIVSNIPLRRMGTPNEVVPMIIFLASTQASYVTGKIIQVDGGQFIG